MPGKLRGTKGQRVKRMRSCLHWPGKFLLALLFWSAVISTNPQEAFAQESTATETPAAASATAPELGLLQKAIRDELEIRGKQQASDGLKERLLAIEAFYEARAYEPIWTENMGPTASAKELVEALNRADEHGLVPSDYDAEALFQKAGVGNETTIADLEVHLSTSLVSYAQHLNAGRVSPREVNRETVIYPDAISPQHLLDKASSTTNIKAFLRLLAPHTPRYERLRVALINYRRIAKDGGWPTVPDGETLKPGMEDPRLPILAERFRVSGDIDPTYEVTSTTYDGKLVEAVKWFQERHGLAVDGVIGPNTLNEINTSVEDRIRTMALNLERRRWMQNDYGLYYIFANLADQVVKVVRNEKTIHAELIQVGKPYHRTPVFSDEMEYLEFNPYWNVPKSIAVNEMLPKLQQNPGHFSGQGFEVLSGGTAIPASAVPWQSYSKANFPVRLRQGPGNRNALGRVKFMFPNQFNVYLHDTPSKQNFDRASRFFSHGCLRLKDPLSMAEVLLKDQGWSRNRIDSVVRSGKRTVVKLDEKIPVHIAYLTAWVNKDGSVHFRRDVYERDPILAKALSKVRGR